MNKFDLSTFDYQKNYAIEASAGTGKTFNIVEIVKKIIDEEIKQDKTKTVDDVLNKILIVTYTEKAAGELKSRLRSKLSTANVDGASIFTFHSFCKSVIDEYAISLNQPAGLSLVDDNYFDNFLDRYIREKEIRQICISAYKIGIQLKLNLFKSSLKAIINNYYLDKNYNEVSEIIELEDKQSHIDVIQVILDLSTSDSFIDLCKKNKKINDYYEYLKNGNEEKERLFADEIANSWNNLFNFNGKLFSEKTFKNIDDSYSLEAFEYFKNLKNIFKNNTVHKNLAFYSANDFYQKWQKEKKINKAQTFDDMIRSVRESLLEGGPLLAKLRNRYIYGIIDEFQDTNQKEFDIFHKIFLEDDKHHLIVVGDPKQSIYSFQGADVFVYQKAVKEISEQPHSEKCYLSKNYRSAPEMVDACNELFKYYNFFGEDDFIKSEHLINGDAKKPKSFLYKGQKIKPILIGVDHNNEPIDCYSFPKIVVDKIIDFCSKDKDGHTNLRINNGDGYKDVSFKDFTILAKSRTEMVYIERELKKVGIPYIRYKDASLFKGNECKQLSTLLEAIEVEDFSGKNRRAFKKALFTPFFGLSLEEINQEKFNKDDTDEAKLIFSWKNLVSSKSWEDLFDSIIIDSNLLVTLKSLNHMQTLSKFKQLSTYCVNYLSKGKCLKDLIRSLTNLADGGTSDDDENEDIVERGTNFDSVQIMTIHASKGLQFPIVISVAGFINQNSDGIYTYHKKIESTGQIHHFIGFDSNLAKEEAIMEWKRLFYVAYTRAEYMMILPDYIKFGQSFLSNTLNDFINNDEEHYSFIHLKENIDYADLIKKTKTILNNHKNIDDSDKLEQEEIIKKMIKKESNFGSYKYSYSSLSHDENYKDNQLIIDEQEIIDKEGQIDGGLSQYDTTAIQIDGLYNQDILPIELPSNYPSGAEIGSALHEIFEVIDYTKYQDDVKQENIMALKEIIKDRLSSYGFKLDEDIINKTSDMVINVLSAKMPAIISDEYFSLNEINNMDKKAEGEFNFNLDENRMLSKYCNGFIDLMFRRNGRYYILDWKSDKLNETFTSYSDKKQLKKHVDDKYSIQRVLYSYCLIKWLKSFMPEISEEEIYDTYFGGVYYVFLRGCNSGYSNGVYAQRWSSWKELDMAFQKIKKEKVRIK